MNIIELVFNIPDQSCPIAGVRLRKFDIRVGIDSTDIGNNALCYHQTTSMGSGETKNFSCHHELFGNWISINKSDTHASYQNLHFVEIRVFGSKLKLNFQNLPRTPHMKTSVHVYARYAFISARIHDVICRPVCLCACVHVIAIKICLYSFGICDMFCSSGLSRCLFLAG